MGSSSVYTRGIQDAEMHETLSSTTPLSHAVTEHDVTAYLLLPTVFVKFTTPKGEHWRVRTV